MKVITFHAQTNDDRFANWTEEQYQVYEDSIRSAIYAPIYACETDNQLNNTYNKTSKNIVQKSSVLNSIYDVPTYKYIDKSKSVGEIPIKSGTTQSGARTYEVPIDVPNGVNEQQPSLSLLYNSMQGNSIMGMGWSIGGLSQISRTAQSIYYDNKPKGVGMDTQDAFVLDGIRLVKTTTYTDYITYESEQGNIRAKGYYQNNIIKYFEVFYPNGNKGIYGFTTNSSNMLYYPLTSLNDYNGNYISFSYNYVGNHYNITKISYNGSSVEFSYKSSREDPIVAYSGGIKTYEDCLLDDITTKIGSDIKGKYTFTYKVDNSHSLLSKINFSSGNSSYNPLEFYYGGGNIYKGFSADSTQLDKWYKSSDPNRIIVAKGKFDYTSGKEGIIVLPRKNQYWKHYRYSTTFQHSQNRFDNDYKGDEEIYVYSKLEYNMAEPTQCLLTEKGFIKILCADLEGKQQEDIIKINNLVENNKDKVTFSVYRKITTGLGLRYTRSFSFNTIYTDASDAKSIQPKYYYQGDFNGDGKIEVLAVSVHQPFGDTTKPSICYIFDLENNNLLFQSHVMPFNMSFIGTEESDQTKVESEKDKLIAFDYDGDGKTDLCHINENGATIYTFDVIGTSLSARKVATYPSLTKASLTHRYINVGEFNGDGMMDLLISPSNTRSGNNTWYVYYSKGNGQFDKVGVTGPANTNSQNSFYTQDINNDGISDVVAVENGSFTVYLTAQNVFGGWKSFSMFSIANPLVVPTDHNSDNYFTKLICIDNNGKAIKYHYSRNDNKEAMLTGMINSLGVIEKTCYQTLDDQTWSSRTGTRLYENGYGAVYPYVNINEPISVVSASEIYLNNKLIDYNAYSYKNAVLHKQGLGFRGFEQLSVVDSQHRTSTQTYNPYNFSTLVREETPTARNIYGYSISVLSNKIAKIRLMHKELYNKLAKTNCSVGYTYDNYGYPTSETSTFSDNITVKTENLYTSNTDLSKLYMLGILRDSKTTTTYNGTTTVSRSYVPVFAGVRPLIKIKYLDGKQIEKNVYSYDSHGNITSVTATPYSSNESQTVQYAYDAFGRKVQETNPLGQTTLYSYDALGRLSSSTDFRGGVTRFTYDESNRVTCVTNPDNTQKSTSYSWVYGGDAVYSITTSGTNVPTVSNTYDAFNREIKNQVACFDHTYIYTEKAYDKYGNLTKQSLPYKGSNATAWINYSYDMYNRPISITEPSGRVTQYQYDGNSTTITEDNVARTKVYNSLGKVVSVTDPAGTISYNLHADGQPMEIVIPGNITTTFGYDEYRRRTSLSDPSLGTTEYEYDDKGNLIKETNANGQLAESEYDTWGRIIRRSTPELSTTYSYNSNNELTSISSDNGTSSTFVYDAFGRIVSKRENCQDGKWLQTDIVYASGKPSSMTYTSQNGVIASENFSYRNSYLTEVKLDNGTIVYRLSKENEFGMPTEATTGGITRKYSFDNFGMPTLRQAYKGTALLQDISFDYDNETKNLLMRKDGIRNMEENFTYDALNRLSTYGEKNVAYDNNGNIISKSDAGTYEYGLTNKPYAVTGLNLNSSSVPTATQNVSYNSFFRPGNISENGYSADLYYNANHDRTKMEVSQNGSVVMTKYYLGANYELEVTPSGSVERLYLDGDYYSAPAVYVKNNGQSGELYNILRDQLGSITHIIKTNGDVVQELSYDAWGRLRDPETLEVYASDEEPTLFIGRGYTGHEHLPTFGLINMNARLYDPVLGRFLSPDPYVQMPDVLQNYNRFSYCMNNPMCYVDKDGKSIILIGSIVAGIYLGGSVANKSFNPFKWNYGSWKTYAGMAVGGLAGYAGATIGAGIAAASGGGLSGSIAAGMAGGMASGAINGAGMTAISGGTIGDIMYGMSYGAIMGGFSGAISAGIGSAIGDFSGVSGSAFKNGMYELGHSALKGAATGLAGGAMMAAMKQDANYLWKSALMGAGISAGVAGIKIATLGSMFIPDPETYGKLANYGQVYRRGSIFMPRTTGITLGNEIAVKLTGFIDYDKYLLQHEIGHIMQINVMGAFNFYIRTAGEYIRYLLKGNFNAIYSTYGTLEYDAQRYAFEQLGYYYHNNERFTQFP